MWFFYDYSGKLYFSGFTSTDKYLIQLFYPKDYNNSRIVVTSSVCSSVTVVSGGTYDKVTNW